MYLHLLLLGSVFLVTGSVVFGILLRRAYLEYDARETLKENVKNKRDMVLLAMEYFKREYDDDFNHTVYESLRIKVNFIIAEIEQLNDENDKLKYYSKAYERLYETGYRLKTDFNNVANIILPLSSLITELTEKLREEGSVKKNGKI